MPEGQQFQFANTTGKRVRLLRLDLGATQGEVAKLLQKNGVDVGRTYVSEIERSNRMPSGEVIAGLARVFNTTSDYLLRLTDNPFRPTRAAAGDLTPDERDISDAFGQVWLEFWRRILVQPPHSRERLLAVFSSILDLLGQAQAEPEVDQEPEPEPVLDPRGAALMEAISAAEDNGMLAPSDIAHLEAELAALVEQRRKSSDINNRQANN
jgi:transcriptional regulator with XRE-family HTH domain